MPGQYEPTQSIGPMGIDNKQLLSPSCHRLKGVSHVEFVFVGNQVDDLAMSCPASMNEALVNRLHSIQHLVD
jgi:hypothetical protein